MDAGTLILGFLFGVLWSLSAGILAAGYILVERADVEVPQGPGTAPYLILSGLVGLLFVWGLIRNPDAFLSG
jgi:hypothetical protein